jgi:hypothetical protein
MRRQVLTNTAGYHSEVLKAAFESQFIEGQTKIYKIGYHHPDTFRLLVQYMYRRSLPGLHTSPISNYQDGLDPKRHSEEEIKSVSKAITKEMDFLTHLWFLADYLLIPRLQNLVLEHLERARLTFGFLSCPKKVWNAGKMDRTNLLWKYSVDNYACWMTFRKEMGYLNNAPKEALIDIMIARQENKEELKLENYFVKEH